MQKNQLGYLYDVRQVKPKNFITQDEGREWIRSAYGKTLHLNDSPGLEKLDAWVDKYTVSSDQISGRYSELDDFTRPISVENEIFFFRDRFLGDTLENRMEFFSNKVEQRASELFIAGSEPPKHIIHTSCTGYVSPSPLQTLFEKRGWRDSEITHAYHMGCYASLPSLRMALGLSHLESEIDIFHSELCTLHFTTEEFSPEQLVVQSLFADGYSAYKASQTAPLTPHFKIIAMKEKRVQASLSDMTWVPGDSGFRMRISKDVPLKLAGEVYLGIESLLVKAGIENEDIENTMKQAIFAVHPGGPKILDQIQMLLGLEDWQIADAKQVLNDEGNMSSATLPHIWQQIAEGQIESGQKIVSLAFGPGLTLFGSFMEYVK